MLLQQYEMLLFCLGILYFYHKKIIHYRCLLTVHLINPVDPVVNWTIHEFQLILPLTMHPPGHLSLSLVTSSIAFTFSENEICITVSSIIELWAYVDGSWIDNKLVSNTLDWYVYGDSSVFDSIIQYFRFNPENVL